MSTQEVAASILLGDVGVLPGRDEELPAQGKIVSVLREQRCSTVRLSLRCDRLPFDGQSICGICYENQRVGLRVLWNGSLGRRGVALTGPWRYSREDDEDERRLASELASAALGASSRGAPEEADELAEECAPQSRRLTQWESRELARKQKKAARGEAEEIVAMVKRGAINDVEARELIAVGKDDEVTLRQFGQVHPEELHRVRSAMQFRSMVLKEFEALISAGVEQAPQLAGGEDQAKQAATVAA